jgi:uncharacterized Fe-S cluster protein YjdI
MIDDFKAYSNDLIEVRYSKSRCTHAAECVKGLRRVFNVRQRPWINVDNASVEEIVEVIHRCPSGALEYTIKQPKESKDHDQD